MINQFSNINNQIPQSAQNTSLLNSNMAPNAALQARARPPVHQLAPHLAGHGLPGARAPGMNALGNIPSIPQQLPTKPGLPTNPLGALGVKSEAPNLNSLQQQFQQTQHNLTTNMPTAAQIQQFQQGLSRFSMPNAQHAMVRGAMPDQKNLLPTPTLLPTQSTMPRHAAAGVPQLQAVNNASISAQFSAGAQQPNGMPSTSAFNPDSFLFNKLFPAARLTGVAPQAAQLANNNPAASGLHRLPYKPRLQQQVSPVASTPALGNPPKLPPALPNFPAQQSLLQQQLQGFGAQSLQNQISNQNAAPTSNPLAQPSSTMPQYPTANFGQSLKSSQPNLIPNSQAPPLLPSGIGLQAPRLPNTLASSIGQTPRLHGVLPSPIRPNLVSPSAHSSGGYTQKLPLPPQPTAQPIPTNYPGQLPNTLPQHASQVTPPVVSSAEPAPLGGGPHYLQMNPAAPPRGPAPPAPQPPQRQPALLTSSPTALTQLQAAVPRSSYQPLQPSPQRTPPSDPRMVASPHARTMSPQLPSGARMPTTPSPGLASTPLPPPPGFQHPRPMAKPAPPTSIQSMAENTGYFGMTPAKPALPGNLPGSTPVGFAGGQLPGQGLSSLPPRLPARMPSPQAGTGAVHNFTAPYAAQPRAAIPSAALASLLDIKSEPMAPQSIQLPGALHSAGGPPAPSALPMQHAAVPVSSHNGVSFPLASKPPTFEQIKLEKPSYPIPEIPDSPKRKAVLENPSKSALPPPKRQSLGGLATNPNKTPASASVPVTSADSGLGSDTTSKKREYICDFCGKRFGKRWDVERHRRYIHTGERPYICNVCGKAFAEPGALAKHKRRHLGQCQCRASERRLGQSGPEADPMLCANCGKPASQTTASADQRNKKKDDEFGGGGPPAPDPLPAGQKIYRSMPKTSIPKASIPFERAVPVTSAPKIPATLGPPPPFHTLRGVRLMGEMDVNIKSEAMCLQPAPPPRAPHVSPRMPVIGVPVSIHAPHPVKREPVVVTTSHVAHQPRMPHPIIQHTSHPPPHLVPPPPPSRQPSLPHVISSSPYPVVTSYGGQLQHHQNPHGS